MINEINVEETKKRLDNDEIVLVDVREKSEKNYADIGGIHIPLAEFADRYKELEEYKDNKDIVIYCRSGARSGQAAMFMKRNGFDNVFNMRGGINEWADKVNSDIKAYWEEEVFLILNSRDGLCRSAQRDEGYLPLSIY